MPYKDKEKEKAKALEYYYKNREDKIKYQREWDKNNKDKKKLQDSKRYKTERYNLVQNIRRYSRQHHFPILIKKYGTCQLKLEECSKDNNLEIHHKKYTKNIKDCLLVCMNCHKKIHRKTL